jgi:hypothetical protein
MTTHSSRAHFLKWLAALILKTLDFTLPRRKVKAVSHCKIKAATLAPLTPGQEEQLEVAETVAETVTESAITWGLRIQPVAITPVIAPTPQTIAIADPWISPIQTETPTESAIQDIAPGLAPIAEPPTVNFDSTETPTESAIQDIAPGLAPIAEPPTVNFDSEAESQPKTPDRAQLVEALLDEAWAQGLRTYPQLIQYVETASGKGCSKRKIASWKKSRKLVEAA